jgi:hypothetical protein
LNSLTGESVPKDEQTTKASENRKSDIIEIQQLNIPESGGVSLSNAEKKKIEKNMSKLYLQLDERVCTVYTSYICMSISFYKRM